MHLFQCPAAQFGPVGHRRSRAAATRSNPVRNRIGDWHSRDRSRACGFEFFVVTGLSGGDRGKTPHVEESPQPLITRRVVRGVDRTMVLPEELLVFWFGEESQDHQRIGGVFRRLRGSRDSAYARLVGLAWLPHGPGCRHCATNEGHPPGRSARPLPHRSR